MLDEQLWIEKYRPKNFEDIIGNDITTIKNQLDNLPNFLFYGPVGTGKTTTAKVIINTLNADYLILNSSLDRSIEIIRHKVKDFVTTKSSNNKIKIVLMDEADGLRYDVQESLRNFIETHSKYVRWIFTCNNINKMRDAIQSRCEEVKFIAPKKGEIFRRLIYILEQEKCTYEHSAVNILVDKLYPDMRRMINKLQVLTNNGKEKLTLEKVKQITTILEKVLEQIRNKNFNEARYILINEIVEPEDFFNELYVYLMENDLTIEKKQNINEIAMQCNYYGTGAFNRMISLEGFVFGLIRLGI